MAFENTSCRTCKKSFTPVSTRDRFCSPHCKFRKYACKQVMEKSAKSGCITWVGEHTTQGSPIFRFRTKSYRAQRWAFSVATGEDTDDCIVFASCGDKSCVAPDHLLKKERRSHLDPDTIMLAEVIRSDPRGTKAIARELELPTELVAYYKSVGYGATLRRIRNKH